MLYENRDEIIGVLEKAETALAKLGPKMEEKFSISEIMLDLEKILPIFNDQPSSTIANLCEALSLLLEKVLVEPVEDERGAVEIARQGVATLKNAVTEPDTDNTDHHATLLIENIKSTFDIDLVTPDETENDDDKFFSELGNADPPAPYLLEGEDSGVKDKKRMTDKLDQLAMDITLLDKKMADKKQVADVIRHFEDIYLDMQGQEFKPTFLAFCKSLSSAFKKHLADGLDNPEKALAIAVESAAIFTGLYEQKDVDQLEAEARALTEAIVNETKPDLPATVTKVERTPAFDTDLVINHQRNITSSEGEKNENMAVVNSNLLDTAGTAQFSSLKVDTEKLDSLLELVGELVISQSIISHDAVLENELNEGLNKNITNLGKITKNIQDQVMTLRMVPLKQTFQKMTRLVRDLSRQEDKPVNFTVAGGDTEIDKTLIEEIADPLVHLLRNAMDHGLETASQRVEAGKDETGAIQLSAFHSGGNVYIEVSDDGRGLDKDRIYAKALEKGLVSDEAEYTDKEICNMILLPGFSTRDTATEISGRGVGMDVVRSNIDKLGGRLEIVSLPGQGSSFSIRLPLTMAIVDGMVVKVGESRFIIPTITIRESVRPDKKDVSTIKSKGEVLNIRGRILPLVRLHKYLQISDSYQTDPWNGIVIIVEYDNKEYGLLVDDILGQQQVVIKALDKRFSGLPGISGGTILGDGCVGLILDVGGVVNMN